MNVERLKAVTPYDARGEAGPRYIVAEENVAACIERHGARWIADGYVRAVVTDYYRGVCYGDDGTTDWRVKGETA